MTIKVETEAIRLGFFRLMIVALGKFPAAQKMLCTYHTPVFQFPVQFTNDFIKITLIANAGVLVEHNGVGLLVDGIHHKEGHPFCRFHTF
jgi:hypothetical protein